MNVFKTIRQKNIDGIVVTNPQNIFYLSGFSGDFSILLLKKSGQKILITDGRYKTIAKELARKNEFHFVLFDELFARKFAPTLRGKWATEDTATLRKFKQLQEWFVGAELIVEKNLVENIRQIKTKIEIEKTKIAAQHVDAVLEKFLPKITIGISEQMAANILENMIRTNGKYETSFTAIVAFGKNTASPHHHPNETKLEKNMPILIDCGAKFEGYCSDMTRNFWFGDEIDTEYENLYTKLLNVQTATNKQFVSGKKISEIDVWVRKQLGEHEQFFTHSLGHGTGLDVHEAPTISKKNDALLQTNEIVTNEPGIYIAEKFGIRIEDQLVIHEKFDTKNILTNFEKKLRMI